MILAEKIQYLRKKQSMSQEILAEKCGVTRQSVSRWEADIALPEMDKLILISNIFGVSLDVLMRDELEIGAVKEVHTCGQVLAGESQGYYEGVLIKESIESEDILDYLDINKVEIWKTGGRPKYWTVLFFTTNDKSFPEKLSKVIKAKEEVAGNWFCDFKAGNRKYIVFREKVLQYEIGNAEQKEAVCDACRKLGIPDEQMQWEE